MYIQYSRDCNCECGGSIYFDGAAGKKAITPVLTDPALIGLEDYSIEFWIKPMLFGIYGVLTNYTPGVNDATHFNVLINGNNLIFTHGFEHITPSITLTNAIRVEVPVTIGEWQHFVFCRNNFGSVSWKVYKNGVRLYPFQYTPIHGTATYFRASQLFGTQITFGEAPSLIPVSFNGYLTNFRLYTRELNEAEVEYNYRYGFGAPFDQYNMAVWIPFNSCWGVGNEGYGSNITLINFPANETALPPFSAWSSDTPISVASQACEEVEELCANEPDPLPVVLCDKLMLEADSDSNISRIGNYTFRLYGGCDSYDPNSSLTLLTNTLIPFHYELAAYTVELTLYLEPPLNDGYIRRVSFDCDQPISDSGVITIPSTLPSHTYIRQILLNLGLNGTIDRIGENVYKIKLQSSNCGNNYLVFSNPSITTAAELNTYVSNTPPKISRDFFDEYCGYKKDCFTGIALYTNLCLVENSVVCRRDTGEYLQMPCNPNVVPASGTPLCTNGRNLWRFGLVVFPNVPPYPNYVNLCTQPIKLVSPCDSFLIKYHNENERPKLVRIEGGVSGVNASKKQEVTYTPKGVNKKLYSAITEEWEVTTAPYSEKWHRKLMQALERDFVFIEINGDMKRVIMEDNYSIDWNNDKEGRRRGIGRFTVKSYNRKVVNEF